jgi:hypothetical protein
VKIKQGPEPETLIVANLWAKQLLEGDLILEARVVETRYGPIKRFTVKRSVAAHAAAGFAYALDLEASR